MKSFLALMLLFLTSFPATAKKDPTVEKRKEFIENYAAALEQSGVSDYTLSWWKLGKVTKLTIYLRGSVASCILWEKQNVEPVRPKAKELGFEEFRLLMPDTKDSATFPDGTWTIKLVDTETNAGYRGVHSQ